MEGGPFSDYQRIFQGLALGLEERGLIRNGHVPLPKDSEEVRVMWEWLHRHAGGNRLVFLADGFYSAEWDSRQREKVRQDVLRRIREKKDVDMVLAFGTWAGQDLAAQDPACPGHRLVRDQCRGRGHHPLGGRFGSGQSGGSHRAGPFQAPGPAVP